MSDKENMKKELQQIAPLLERLREENPFSTPQGYFDELPVSIREKISAAEVLQEGKNIPVFQKLPRFALIGVVSVLLMVAGYFFLLKDSAHTLNGLADEGFYEEYMVWYADYQADAYYEIILENDPGFPGITEPDENEQIIDYLMDYNYYYMESPDDIID